MPLPTALAFSAIPLTPSELRWELAGVAIGFILLSIGVAALALFLFRRRTSDFTLVYFSSFSILYAIRLLCRERFIRWLFPVRESVSNHFDLVIDCFIPVPFTLFLMQIAEPRWKNVLRWIAGAQLAFGVTRLMSAVLHIGEKAMGLGNNIFVIGTCVLIAVYYLYTIPRPGEARSREITAVFVGLAVFVPRGAVSCRGSRQQSEHTSRSRRCC